MPSVDEQILAELREIKRLLTPAPPAPPAAPKGLIEEFKMFLSQYKVLGLAVAFILGVYLGALVQGTGDRPDSANTFIRPSIRTGFQHV